MGVSFQFHHHLSRGRGRPFDRLMVLSNVEGHHIFAYDEAAPRTMVPQRRAFLVLARRYCGGPARRMLSALGVVVSRIGLEFCLTDLSGVTSR